MKIASLFHRLRYRFYKTPHERVCADWFARNGDKTLRLDYDLGAQSVVLDLGGYEGQYASDIVARYCCRVIVFEPIPEYAASIRSRFLLNQKVGVVEAAVGKGTGELRMHLAADRSSAYTASGRVAVVRKMDLLDYLRDVNIIEVDLVKMNIEGGEYELLEYLIKLNAVPRFRNLQIQFHRSVENYENRLAIIRRKLEETHELTWQYPFLWESWRIRAKD